MTSGLLQNHLYTFKDILQQAESERREQEITILNRLTGHYTPKFTACSHGMGKEPLSK